MTGEPGQDRYLQKLPHLHSGPIFRDRHYLDGPDDQGSNRVNILIYQCSEINLLRSDRPNLPNMFGPKREGG